jgi:hypothetical protein
LLLKGFREMLRRRQILQLAALPVAWSIPPSFALALGGAAALSGQLTGRARLRMRASSTTTGSHWGIYVQEVAVRDAKLVPRALIACFEFGRKQDPFVYPQLVSSALPVIAEIDRPYKIAVYFLQNREVVLQPHSDAAIMANHLESRTDAKGRTSSLTASHWDNDDLPLAAIHEISIQFDYPD